MNRDYCHFQVPLYLSGERMFCWDYFIKFGNVLPCLIVGRYALTQETGHYFLVLSLEQMHGIFCVLHSLNGTKKNIIYLERWEKKVHDCDVSFAIFLTNLKGKMWCKDLSRPNVTHKKKANAVHRNNRRKRKRITRSKGQYSLFYDNHWKQTFCLALFSQQSEQTKNMKCNKLKATNGWKKNETKYGNKEINCSLEKW